MNCLVTGGAGYIGSHVVRRLLDAGHQVVVLDNLSTSFRWAVDPRAQFVEGDLASAEALESAISLAKSLVGSSTDDSANSKLRVQNRSSVNSQATSSEPWSLMHFAALTEVPASIVNPANFFRNNTILSFQLFELALKHKVRAIIFSSTAAVYGQGDGRPLAETAPCVPMNPYGVSKLMAENMLLELMKVNPDSRALILRYFNVAGASDDCTLGQATPNAVHLVKVACEVALGHRPLLDIFGQDYQTKDGTCERDYLHVEDLADAHLRALEYIISGNAKTDIFNVGYGKPYSVNEVITAINRLLPTPIATRASHRRDGDPASVSADPRKIQQTLGWIPKRADIELICRSALDWEKKYQKKRAEIK
jgi:UDP-glucose 4-epimerase